jgi:DNA mismatch endonuclease, patch repair protein
MPDNLTPEQRRACMRAIRSIDTAPECIVRSYLHRLGFRFRLHVVGLPGKPDLVLPRYKTVIFIHGCFWHHHGCRRSVIPKSRKSYWVPKLNNTRKRDLKHKRLLRRNGWRVITLWECELNNPKKLERRCLKLILRTKKYRKNQIEDKPKSRRMTSSIRPSTVLASRASRRV